MSARRPAAKLRKLSALFTKNPLLAAGFFISAHARVPDAANVSDGFHRKTLVDSFYTNESITTATALSLLRFQNSNTAYATTRPLHRRDSL